MLTPEQIERIEAFDGQGARMLSVYLDVDPASQVRRSYRIVFEDMVKDARERLEGPARGELADEAGHRPSLRHLSVRQSRVPVPSAKRRIHRGPGLRGEGKL